MSTRPRRWRSTVSLVALAVIGAPALPRAAAGDTHAADAAVRVQRSAQDPASTAIEVVKQPFVVQPGTSFPLTVHAAMSSPIVAVSVAIRTVTGAGQLDALANGDFSNPDDVVERARYQHSPSTDDTTVTVETAAPDGDPTAATLDLAPGVSALRVTVTTADGATRSTTTFVNVDTPDDAEPSGTTSGTPSGTSTAAAALPVAVVVGLPVELTRVGTHLVLPERAAAQIDTLIDVLDQVSPPVAVYLAPGILSRLVHNDPQRAERLAAALTDNQLLAEPILPLDPSFAAAANLNGTYTAWLRAGEDLAASTIGQQSRRQVGVIKTQTSIEGATLRRDLGTRLVVISTEQFDRLPSGPGPGFEASGTFRIGLGNGADLEAMIPEPVIARLLQTRTNPIATAARIAAAVIFERQALLDAGIDPGRRALIVSTPDLGLPNATTMPALTAFLGETAAIDPQPLSDLGGRVEPAIAGSANQPLTATLVTTLGPGSLDLRIAAITNARSTASTLAGVLPIDDPRPAKWAGQLDELTSTAFPDDAVGATLVALSNEQTSIIGDIQWPASYNVTLGSRQATLRLKLTNNGPTQLDVRLRLIAGADKIRFPDNDTVYELPANSATEVKIPIEARTNGRIPVLAQLLAPGADSRVLSSLPLTITVNGLNGLGLLISGAGALILGAWWVRHFRRTRAGRRTATLPEP